MNLVGTSDKPFVGYISSKDKTNISPQALIRGSKNVYKKLSGTWSVRPGLLRRGDADGTAEGVKSSWEWYNSLNKTLPLRVANGKLQVESDIVTSGTYVWYDLLTGLTNTRFVFDAWWDNTEKKDRLLMVNGEANIKHWSGGMALVDSATANTITLQGTKTWQEMGFSPTSGEMKVTISGTEYTYTGGQATTTLTGVTPDASGIISGDVAIQSVLTETDKPAAGFLADFLRVIGNQVYVGSYSSRLVYVSDDGNFKDYTVPTPRIPGSPELLTLDNTTKGIGIRNGHAFISAGTSDWYEVSFENLTVGSTLTQKTTVDKKPVATLCAAYAHEFIDMIGDEIVYLSQDQQMRVIGSFRNIFTTKYPSLSLAVKDELTAEDFTGGHLRAIGDIIYITAPNNGRDWMHETREQMDSQGNITAERFWHAPQIRNIARFAVIGGVVYGHSNANPQIYQVWQTAQWHDDSPDDEDLPYVSVARFAYQNLGRPQGMLTFDKAFWEGYISQGTQLDAHVYYNYEGAENIQNPNINSILSPAYMMSGQDPASLGDFPLGDNPLGDGLIEDVEQQDLLPKFKVISDLNPTDCFEFSLELYSTEADSRWEILRLGVNAMLSARQSPFIRK